MGQSYFIWNGIDCRNMGVWLSGPAPIIRPEERVQHITIPGRAGDLTLLEGENIFNSYIQTVTLLVKGGFHVRDVYDWLRGSGYVTFSGEPDRKQAARIIGAVTLNRHSHNLDWWVGEVQFYCQPLKELLDPGTVEITTTQSVVYNRGDVAAKPKINLTVATGASMATVTINGATLAIGDLSAGTTYVIDCDAMEVTDAARTTILTGLSTGEFPVLVPGSNTVYFDGCSKLVFDRRERFL